MVDFFVVVMSVIGVCIVAWFITMNDEPGNTRPSKTPLAMRQDPGPKPTRYRM